MLQTVHDTYPVTQGEADPSRSATGNRLVGSRPVQHVRMVGKQTRPTVRTRIRGAFLAFALLTMSALSIGGYTALRIEARVGLLAGWCYAPTLQQCG